MDFSEMPYRTYRRGHVAMLSPRLILPPIDFGHGDEEENLHHDHQ
jgi:hypothetical protein